MKRRTVFGLATGLAGLALAGCAEGSPKPSPEVPAELTLLTSKEETRSTGVKDATDLSSLVAASQKFGLQALSAAGTESMVFSPVSVWLALGMLTAGASGKAKTELEQLLGASGDALHLAMNAIITRFSEFAGDPAKVAEGVPPENPLVHVANNLVAKDGFKVNQPFIDALKSYYGASAGQADLTSHKGKEALDAWVKKNSGGLIEKSAIEPNPDLKLVLQNAVVFGARWMTPFDKHNTRPRSFTGSDNVMVEVPTMAGSLEAEVAEQGGWSALRLPYSKGFSALFVLPPKGTAVSSITPELLGALRSGLARKSLSVTIPQLKLSSRTDLLDAVGRAGVVSVFEGQGEPLSGIAPGGLFLGQAVQQAVLNLGEEGTVAAAVTELAIESRAAREETLAFDRPFLVQVEENETNLVLFQVAVNKLSA